MIHIRFLPCIPCLPSIHQSVIERMLLTFIRNFIFLQFGSLIFITKKNKMEWEKENNIETICYETKNFSYNWRFDSLFTYFTPL